MCWTNSHFPAIGRIGEDDAVFVFLGHVRTVKLQRVGQFQVGSLDAVQDHVHGAQQVGKRLDFDAVEGVALKFVKLLAAEVGAFTDIVGGLTKETRRAETWVVNPVACLGLDHLDHGADDVPLCVELARVSGGVGGHALEEIFINLREHDDIGFIGEMQFVDLLNDFGEGSAPSAVVAHVVKNASETLGQQVISQSLLGVGAGELGPELALHEFQHPVWVIGVLGPGRPSVLTGETALVRRVVESGFFFLAGLSLVEGLEEKKPGQLLDVVASVHTLLVELVAGILYDLLNFLPAVIIVFAHSLLPLNRCQQSSTYFQCH